MPSDPSLLSAGDFQVFIDFDNTITQGDVLDSVIEHFSAGARPAELEEQWQQGLIGARACLDGQLREIRGGWGDISRFLGSVTFDPGFAELHSLLRGRGIPITILTDNFDLIIDEILAQQGYSDVPHHSNHLVESRGEYAPSFPYYNPQCPGCAHCKKTHFVPRRDERLVIYIGDGRSDICPATHADVVFAKDGLLRYLQSQGVECHPFKDLSEVASTLKTFLHAHSS